MEKDNKKAELEIRKEIAALKIESFTMYGDSSHSWLEVPFALLELLKIDGLITECSYQSRDGKKVYLEEDVDAYTFIIAYRDALHSREVERIPIVDRYSEHSFVRALPRYARKIG